MPLPGGLRTRDFQSIGWSERDRHKNIVHSGVDRLSLWKSGYVRRYLPRLRSPQLYGDHCSGQILSAKGEPLDDHSGDPPDLSRDVLLFHLNRRSVAFPRLLFTHARHRKRGHPGNTPISGRSGSPEWMVVNESKNPFHRRVCLHDQPHRNPRPAPGSL